MRKIGLFLSIISLVCISCIDEVDFDQADDVVIAPVMDVNLVFFNVTQDAFQNVDTGEFVGSIRDTTRIEFLEGDVIQEDLMQVDIVQQFDNGFSIGLDARLAFLNEMDEVQYEIEFEVPPSGTSNEITIVIDPDLQGIQSSVKLVTEITVEGSGTIVGSLGYKSKGVFYFIFDEL